MIADLRAHELWPSPLADAALFEFRIRLSERVLDERRPDYVLNQRQAVLDLKQEIKPLWDRGEIETFLGVALSLEHAGALNDAYRRRLAWSLLRAGLFDRSAEVYVSLKDDDHHRWREQALALAGANRLDAAADAISRSMEQLAAAAPEADVEAAVKFLNRRVGALELASGWVEKRRRILKRIQSDRREAGAGMLKAWFETLSGLIAEAIAACREDDAGGESPGWARARERALAWLLLGRPDRAANPLVEAAGSAPELSPAELEDALSLITIAAAAQPLEIQGELLDAAALLAEPGAARQALKAAMSVVAGADWRQAAWPDGDPGQPALALIATACARSERLEAAVAMFAAVSQMVPPREEGPRRELVACQSLETLGRLEPKPGKRAGAGRVFDLFPYNGELEVLKIKLHEMAPWVDRFVLVETATTFAGKPKPLYFEAHRDALGEFLPKIEHVVVKRFPNHAASPRARESFQRDEAIKGLDGLWSADDLVLLTDADEVIDRRALEGFKADVAPLRMHTFRYFLNHRFDASVSGQVGDASVWRAALLEHYGASLARTVLAPSLANARIENAGWRFAAIGGASEAARQLSSSSQQETGRPDTQEHHEDLLACLRAGESEPGWEVCDPELLPAYVRKNWNALKPLLL